jgi:glycerol-3-phosphate dehydrogenase
MPNLGEAFPRPYQQADRIAEDPAYGHVVCFCERVTAGEIRDAFRSPLPPAGMDGLRRRTRVMNGRCQGFFCGAEVGALFAAAGGAEGPTDTPGPTGDPCATGHPGVGGDARVDGDPESIGTSGSTGTTTTENTQ